MNRPVESEQSQHQTISKIQGCFKSEMNSYKEYVLTMPINPVANTPL